MERDLNLPDTPIGAADPVFAPKCIWCNAPWSDSNIRVFDFDCGDHCESGRFGPEEVTVSIVCHACNREMYRKEGAENCYSDLEWRQPL